MEYTPYTLLTERKRALGHPMLPYRNFWWQADIPSGYSWSVVKYTQGAPNIVEYVTHIFSQSNYASLQCVEILYNGSSIYAKCTSTGYIFIRFPLPFLPVLKTGDSITIRTYKPSSAIYNVFGCMCTYRQVISGG